MLEPGEVAATAGTSGVVYAVSDTPRADVEGRVNTFLHVNHQRQRPRHGTLLCINGAGSLYRWLRHTVMESGTAYADMNREAARAPVGADGLSLLPFGNGSERLLHDQLTGARLDGLDFNRHTRAHLLRAAQEGIVFALHHGLQMMRGLGLETRTVRAAAANLFLSPLFCSAFATLNDVRLELYDTRWRPRRRPSRRTWGRSVPRYGRGAVPSEGSGGFRTGARRIAGVPRGIRALVLCS